MEEESWISPSCFLISRRLFSSQVSPSGVRSPEQKFIHHGAQADQDPHVEHGDHYQHELAVPQLVLPATPLLQLVASKSVDEVFAVRLLLLFDKLWGEKSRKK